MSVIEIQFKELLTLNHKLGVELAEKVLEFEALTQTSVQKIQNDVADSDTMPSFMKVLSAEAKLSQLNTEFKISSPDVILKKNPLMLKRSVDIYNQSLLNSSKKEHHVYMVGNDVSRESNILQESSISPKMCNQK